jgi:hypothetical protein
LPIAEGWQYQHAALALNGAQVRESVAGIEAEIKRLQEELANGCHSTTGT